MLPKSTALWLVDNTALTFEQIADFCGLHALEVQAIADGDVLVGAINFDPIAQGQISKEDVKDCEKDPSKRLTLIEKEDPLPKKKRSKYTPVSKRADKPNAIAWLLKHHPELSDGQICQLLGTTRATIHAIRDKTHWNIKNIRSQSPVTLSLCSENDLSDYLKKAQN
jgi:uncharacterized protein